MRVMSITRTVIPGVLFSRGLNASPTPRYIPAPRRTAIPSV
jgi:hypothetical protein